MKKILKKGKVPPQTTFIYRGTCSYCGTQFEFEEEDFETVERLKNLSGYILGIVECPFCNSKIKVSTADYSLKVIKKNIKN